MHAIGLASSTPDSQPFSHTGRSDPTREASRDLHRGGSMGAAWADADRTSPRIAATVPQRSLAHSPGRRAHRWRGSGARWGRGRAELEAARRCARMGVSTPCAAPRSAPHRMDSLPRCRQMGRHRRNRGRSSSSHERASA
eukprot:7033841-Prymnesium_polylepis.1